MGAEQSRVHLRLDLARHRMQRTNEHDAHVAEVHVAFGERAAPRRFGLREALPHFDRMSWRDAARKQKCRDVFRHEIPWTRNHDGIPAILQNVHQMFLEGSEIAASVERHERGFVKANTPARSENLRGADAGDRFHSMLAGALDTLEKLESGKMNVTHENDRALQTLMVQRSALPQFFNLIFVTHRHDAFCTHQWTHKSDDRCKTSENIRRFDEFFAALRQITEIARTGTNAPDHKIAILVC